MVAIANRVESTMAEARAQANSLPAAPPPEISDIAHAECWLAVTTAYRHEIITKAEGNSLIAVLKRSATEHNAQPTWVKYGAFLCVAEIIRQLDERAVTK